MQKLSKAAIGRSYTIQWMFGVPEVMDFLREHHVEEGDNIQIIRKLRKMDYKVLESDTL